MLGLSDLDEQASRFPWTIIEWNTALGVSVATPNLGVSVATPNKHSLGGKFLAGFGNINTDPHRKITITKRTQDSSPIFSITLEPENKSHEEAANTTLGFLVVPQGSLLYFESETVLSKLKSTLTAPTTNP